MGLVRPYLGMNFAVFKSNESRCLLNSSCSAVEKFGNDLRLYFNSASGANYQLQSRTNLTQGTWNPVEGSIPGNGATVQATITNTFGQPQQFFQIHQLP